MKRMIAIVLMIGLLCCSMTACAKKAETGAASSVMQKLLSNMPKDADLTAVDGKVAIAGGSSAQAFIAADEKLGKLEPNAKINATLRIGAQGLGFIDVPGDWSSFMEGDVFYCQDSAATGQMSFANSSIPLPSGSTEEEFLDAYTQAMWQVVFAGDYGISEAKGAALALDGYQTLMSMGMDEDNGLLAFFIFFDGSGLLHVLTIYGEMETAYEMLTYISDSYSLS